MHTIVGLDLGTTNFGVGIVNVINSQPVYLGDSLLIIRSSSLEDKIIELESFLSILANSLTMNQNQKLYLAYESTLLKSSTGRIMDILSGAIISFCVRNKIPVKGINPCTVKKCLTGKGNATKIEVEEKVRSLLQLPKSFQFKTDHNSDALAVALATFECFIKQKRLEFDT